MSEGDRMPKKIFIGSSRESISLMREVAVWVEEAQCQPLCWDDPELFLPGDNTFLKLQEISRTVDGAILIFSADDKIWYRGDSSLQPRDNLLIEYGMFAGYLGQHKAAICTSGQLRTATDLAGIIMAELDPARKQYARRKMLAWLNRVDTGRADPVTVQLSVARKQLDDKEEEINFLRTANADLLSRITISSNFIDEQWESLFTFDYVFDVQRIATKYISNTSSWRAFMNNDSIIDIGSHVEEPYNNDRLPFSVRKVLRVIRNYYTSKEFGLFLSLLPNGAQEEINGLKTWKRRS